MKITLSELRKIIKEELSSDSFTVSSITRDVHAAEYIDSITKVWTKMFDPNKMIDRSGGRYDWEQEVAFAADEAEQKLHELIDDIESRLLSGDYKKEPLK